MHGRHSFTNGIRSIIGDIDAVKPAVVDGMYVVINDYGWDTGSIRPGRYKTKNRAVCSSAFCLVTKSRGRSCQRNRKTPETS